ncbi:hypothetical protein ACO0LF_27070 [Undibacterium sp. Di27W]|uniref:hypothetical protein n=1 Tax=Undibacterium sp. Di27W TaxID=3413036 RepID=UPI003BF33F09
MMSRNFSRTGLWLFMFAVFWYLVANFLLDDLKKEQIARAYGGRLKQEYVSIGSNNKLVIRTTGEDFSVHNVSLVFDPGLTQALIKNENVQIAVNTQMQDGVLTLGMVQADVSVNDRHSSSLIEIRLPSSVNQVEFAGHGTIKISGNFPSTSTELMLKSLSCDASLSIEGLTVAQLNYQVSSKQEENKKTCFPVFDMSAVNRIDKLEVSMSHGRLNVGNKITPKTTVLTLSDDVNVTAQSEFLRAATFKPYVP